MIFTIKLRRGGMAHVPNIRAAHAARFIVGFLIAGALRMIRRVEPSIRRQRCNPLFPCLPSFPPTGAKFQKKMMFQTTVYLKGNPTISSSKMPGTRPVLKLSMTRAASGITAPRIRFSISALKAILSQLIFQPLQIQIAIYEFA